MKKFLITLIILLALAGTGFFFGWANFAIPPGYYGIVSSKSHGIDPEIVQAGKFRWIWYKLIPTNVTISIFKLEHQQFPINSTGSLPSGDTYAQFVGLNNIDFSWELRGNMSFSIKPDKLFEIVSQNNIKDQDDFNNYISNIAERISQSILNSIANGSPEYIEALLSGRDESISALITGSFPVITDFSFTINNAKIPDFILYTEVRAIYEDFLAKQREFITASFGQRAENHIETQLRFTELERYGELLTKYPILLEYLALEAELQ